MTGKLRAAMAVVVSSVANRLMGTRDGLRRQIEELVELVSLEPSGRRISSGACMVEGLEQRQMLTLNGNDTHAENWVYNAGSCTYDYVSPFLMSDLQEESSCSCPDSSVGPGDITGTDQPAVSASAVGGKGIKLTDGSPIITGHDLTSVAQGKAWGQTRSYGTTVSSTGVGNRWTIQELPYIVLDNSDTTAIVVDSGARQRWYDSSEGGYAGRMVGNGSITHVGDKLILTDGSGEKTAFYDFESGTPAARRGKFASYADAAGNTVTASYNGSDQVTSVARFNDGVMESLVYAYVSWGENAGLISQVQLQCGGTTVRSVEYSYYGSSESFGTTGDLKLVVIKNAACPTHRNLRIRAA